MKKKNIINTIFKYSVIFILLISILISIFLKYNKSFVWINVSNDGLDQHLINLHYFKILLTDFIKLGSINTFTWKIGYGMDMFANLAYYIFGDFLSYLSLIVKYENLDILYHIIIIVRLYLTGISFIIYGDYKKLSNTNNLIGSITYTFSTFSLFALARHPYFMNPLIIFPLLLLATERIIKENKPIFFTVMVFITFLSSFYFGYMLALWIMIYGIIIAFTYHKNKTKKEIFNILLKTFLHAAVGLLLSFFILIPTAYAFLTSTRTDSSIYLYTLTYYKNLLTSIISTNNTGYWSLIGLSSIILVILPTFIKNRKKHQDIFIYLITLIIPLFIPIIGSVFAGFSYPNNRWSFIISFTLSYIIAITLDKNYKINIKHTLITIISYTLIILLIKQKINYQIIVSLICSILLAITIYNKQKIKKGYSIILLLILITNIGYNIYYMYDKKHNGYVLEFTESNPTNLYNNANYEIPYLNEATKYLNEIDKTYYNTIIYPNKLYNLSMINDYNSISYFYSIVSNNYLQLSQELENQELGINKEIKNFNQRTKITTLLNTKYFITTDKSYAPYGYELIKNYNNQTYIYINKYYTNFASLYTKYIDNETYDKLTPIEKEAIMLKATVLENQKNYLQNLNISTINYDIKTTNIINVNQINITENNKSIYIPTNNIKNSEVYLYIKNINYKPSNILENNSYNITVNINNKEITESTKDKQTNAYYFENNDILINLGYYDIINTNVKLTFSDIGTYTYDSIEILTVDFKEYEEDINNLNNSNFNLIEYKNNYLKGTVNTNENGILQFATNYSKGWKVYIDNKEVNTLKSNKYFLGVNIEKGYHEITLIYKTPYQRIGTIGTTIGAFMLIYLIYKERKKK